VERLRSKAPHTTIILLLVEEIAPELFGNADGIPRSITTYGGQSLRCAIQPPLLFRILDLEMLDRHLDRGLLIEFLGATGTCRIARAAKRMKPHAQALQRISRSRAVALRWRYTPS
jgi:hypothetical protein